MSEIMKHLAERLHRHYGPMLRSPLPWRMIDALVSLEERLEERARQRTGGRSRNAGAEAADADSISQQNDMKRPPSSRQD